MHYETVDQSNEIKTHALSARGSAHYAKGLLLTGSKHEAATWLRDELGPGHPVMPRIERAAAAAVTTGNSPLAWATINTAYAQLLRRREIIGQLPGTVPAAPGVRVPVLGEPTAAAWGIPLPAVVPTVAEAQSAMHAHGCVLGVSQEFLRNGGDAAVTALDLLLARVTSKHTNDFFLDVEAAVEGRRPAGLLYGLTAIGTGSPESADEGALHLLAETRSGEPLAPAFVASTAGALYLSSLNRPMFANVNAVTGGTIGGIPLIISRAAENRLILIDGASIIVTDGGLVLDSADSASVVLDTAPTSPAAMTSGFQTDTRFLRVVRYVSWIRAHSDAVAFLELPLLSYGSPTL